MKRMLEEKDGTIYINSSSVEIINSCLRKAQFALHRGLRREDESEALTFGKAIHEALATFYSGDRSTNVLKVFENAASPIAHLTDDKRSIANGKKILEKYMATYKDDPWEVYVDDKGPFVERSFELPLTDGLVIHGQIDCILRNTETGELCVVDHKTTTAVSDLINRAKPNIQFSIYSWAANQLGLPVKRVMLNGIQVAKTKCDLMRIFTERNDEDFQEMRWTIINAAINYKHAKESGVWPQSTSSCANWGGCQYLEVCQASHSMREAMITQIYGSLTG